MTGHHYINIYERADPLRPGEQPALMAKIFYTEDEAIEDALEGYPGWLWCHCIAEKWFANAWHPTLADIEDKIIARQLAAKREALAQPARSWE